jgi:DNA-binding transcriptional ArsR family regulator
MTNKMTNKKALEIAIATLGAQETPNTEVIEKLEKILEQTVKKNSAERKPTATQVANEGLKADIVAFLSDGKRATVTEIMKGVASLEGLSNQKVSAIVRQLKEDGVVIRIEEKRKVYFYLNTETEE